MLTSLKRKWKVKGPQLFWILCVFALTGTLTAYIAKSAAGWAGFNSRTYWVWKIALRLGILLFAYPFIIIIVAFFLGQFRFFWEYEKKILQRLGIMKKTSGLPAMTSTPVNTIKKGIAIFASGAGSNAQQIIHYFKNSALVSVALIVCNKPDAGVVAVADRERIPLLLIQRERFFRGDGYVQSLQEAGIYLIVLAGFLWKVPDTLISAFPRRIINIHPALLPLYGGKGMYGAHVHAAVLQAGDATSGITVHYVNGEYDKGDIIYQQECPVEKEDTPETLAQKIHRLEHASYPQVIEKLLQ